MSLNQNDRVVLMASPVMQTRCAAACVQYALYLLNGSPTTNQTAWAKGCLDDTATMGRRVSQYLLNNSDFLTNGSDITDAQLQGAAEAAINAFFVGA